MRLLALLLVPLAFAAPTEGNHPGINGRGGSTPDKDCVCSTGRVTSTTTVWKTIPQAAQTTTSTVFGNCWSTITQTTTKTTTVKDNKTVTKTTTPVVYVTDPVPTITKTLTKTYTQYQPQGKRAAETGAVERDLTNAERLQRGLPLRVPGVVAKKRTYGAGWTPEVKPKPSCTPTVTTIWTTVSKTTKPCVTSTVKVTSCKPTTTTSTKTKTETACGSTITNKVTTTLTSTKPPCSTSTVLTTVSKTITTTQGRS
ncbi:hypothetical protein CcaverHIS002_0606320 [Cutaneotrichosporon cavernicola]|uniref:Flo11 domain-containing protein n=1 Tax=Cutaneotrichosporon cavernicola TaxID=279322 RepID=A0AA48L8Y3_9TREE|nr:uncharacterized protein CcaverHIS019_0605780 [Cutaneotrichosporon cavernicola]BEI86345.1 hypothetical protein CcaverHIS002_0606320 [Cutaneotrichosporon cavernicola]BEI94119.1 hypothetical protein CcaverHIS019_0605780 [Cutaneotrichosporon cavernicola]BEJ01898.1 hypothetical protein CcaverHIS631_0605800 [Cutaneotrichosporon cavernicola]